MKRRNAWCLCSMPVLGVALAYALPPIDEYAAIDRLAGSPPMRLGGAENPLARGQIEGQAGSLGGLANPPSPMPAMYGRPSTRTEDLRVWRFATRQDETLRFRGRFLSRRRGWQRTDVSGGTYGPSFRRVSYVREEYLNDATGDRLQWTEESWSEGTERKTAYVVFVERSESSTHLTNKLARWLSLGLR